MNRQQLTEQIFQKRSYLCVGLDTDIRKIPQHLHHHADPIFEFNRQIIDATKDLCVAYKINTAFYEAEGLKGWEAMERTVKYIPPTHFIIADAKRGDIGNTSAQYAIAFFERMNFDAITVAPYMGADSVQPFLAYKDRWAIVLCLTSNPGAADFELRTLIEREDILDEGIHITREHTCFLYEKVLDTVASWGTQENMMFVVGATRADQFAAVRKRTPHHFYLVPGVGAQGGSLKEISERALIGDCGLLVNASRAVIFASAGEDFAEKAGVVARKYQEEMSVYLSQLTNSR